MNPYQYYQQTPPSQGLAFQALNDPNLGDDGTRTALYNSIYRAAQQGQIQQEQSMGLPRTTFINEADAYNYRTQMGQAAQTRRLATLQNPDPRAQYVNQLNTSPEIRNMVIQADPAAYRAYGDSLALRSMPVDSSLLPSKVGAYQGWKAKYAPNDPGNDYDYRGAFNAGLTPAPNGHWPDTYKKPNHPTFSNESIYAKDYPSSAGSWNGNTFVPPRNSVGPITDPSKLLNSPTFRNLTPEMQDQVGRTLNVDVSRMRAGEAFQNKESEDIVARLVANNSLRIINNPGSPYPTFMTKGKKQITDATGSIKEVEDFIPVEPATAALLYRGMARGRIPQTMYQNPSQVGRETPVAIVPPAVPANRTIAPTTTPINNPVQNAIARAYQEQAPSGFKTFEESLPQYPTGALVNAPFLGAARAYENYGGFGSTPGSTEASMNAPMTGIAQGIDPGERSWYIFQSLRQRGMDMQTIKDRMMKLGLPMPVVPKQPMQPEAAMGHFNGFPMG